jgi:hypothetical protein
MANSEHIDELQADTTHRKDNATSGGGCVTKCVGSSFKKHHGSYRRNGYEEHKSNKLKSTRYAPIPDRVEKFGPPIPEQLFGVALGKLRTPVLPAKPGLHWTFTGRNFISANQPFVHQYHHMVPWEVLSESFELDELKLLQSDQYNLNDGFNLIILPCYEKIGILIGMYTHPNDHPLYTLDLISKLRFLKEQMKGDEEEHLAPDEVSGLRSTLEAWERGEWIKIAEAGRLAMGAHVNGYKPSSLPVVSNA